MIRTLVKVTRSPLFLGLLNQAIVSLGAFAFNLTVARALPIADYGLTALMLSVMVFLNAIHQSLITYPLSIGVTTASPVDIPAMKSIAILQTLALCAPFTAAIAFVAASHADWGLFLSASAALIAWQIQEVIRRTLLALGRYWRATLGDCIRYLGAFGLAIGASLADSLSPNAVFIMIAAAAMLATAVTFRGTKQWRFPSRLQLKEGWKSQAKMGLPAFWATLFGSFPIPWFLWLLTFKEGLASAAILQALINVASIGRPVALGMENILVPEIARQRSNISFQDLMKFLLHCGVIGAILMFPLFAIVVFAPRSTLALLYGSNSPYTEFPSQLQILMCIFMAYPAAVIIAATLKAYNANEGLIKMQLYPAVCALLFGTWVIMELGLVGLCLAWVGSAFIGTVVGARYLSRIRTITLQRVPSMDV